MGALTAIDLFAGCGGFTEGALRAGVDVLWAANHWPLAVSIHEAANPGIAHECQDLTQADFTKVPAHDLLLASPACQGHSKARGKDRPHHDVTRATAWAVISAVESNLPRAVVVENVPEFAEWKLFRIWLDALEAYGYRVTTQVLDAADAGTPQNRERLFVVATRDVGPVEISDGQAVHVPASSFVDLEAGRWSPTHKPGRAERTLACVDHGRAHFGENFLVPYYGGTRTARSLERPIGTIRTREAWAVVRGGDEFRMLSKTELTAAMGFGPQRFESLSQKKACFLLGNAVPPQLAELVVGQVVEALS